MEKTVQIYDTTLRDGMQGEGISFLLADKLRIVEKLDELGIHYIEGGWPGSNPKDDEFFEEIRKIPLKNSKIVAFGATRRARMSADSDTNLISLVRVCPDTVAIFGKSWDLHVQKALRVTFEENLEMIFDSVRFLKGNIDEVIYDAEHFFDGYRANPEYALKTLQVAQDAGVDSIVLCDTNGGTLPQQIPFIMRHVRQLITVPLGIHAHNDSGCAVANSLMAVEHGAVCVQGSINGFGERCGNADLCAVIPDLQLKMGKLCISTQQLRNLSEVSRFVYELANLIPDRHQPYVGNSAFAHKGGVHVAAVQRYPETYEHITPEKVGNVSRVLISELSGRASVLTKAREFHIDVDSTDPVTVEILEKLKSMERAGYQFEGAEASFELLMRKALGTLPNFFKIMGFRVLNSKADEGGQTLAEATIKVEVEGRVEHTAAEGHGPVNALDNALRKALERFYPRLREMRLIDFKVRVLPAGLGTASVIRVLVESDDGDMRWGTVGVSYDIIDASYHALVDALQYKLLKDSQHILRKGVP